MDNIKLVVAYDGGAYLGWQKTSTGPSIEGAIQNAIEQIVQHPIDLQAASRTDAGVHAKGQVVNFLTSKTTLDLSKLQTSLNQLLPKDIVVLTAERRPPSFHPTLDCTGKEYHYFICLGAAQLPHLRLYSWHVPYSLNLEDMQAALPYLIGKHDFTSFTNGKKNENTKDHHREIHFLKLIELDQNRLCIQMAGNHFLYKMVRNIVGTLIYIGRGKIVVEELPKILLAASRPQAGMTAPPHGLFLSHVSY